MRFRKPHGIPHVEADTMFRYTFKILPDRLKLIGCILVGLSGKVSVSSSELELAILKRLPRGIWSRDLGVMAKLSENASWPATLTENASWRR